MKKSMDTDASGERLEALLSRERASGRNGRERVQHESLNLVRFADE